MWEYYTYVIKSQFCIKCSLQFYKRPFLKDSDEVIAVVIYWNMEKYRNSVYMEKMSLSYSNSLKINICDKHLYSELC